MSLSLSRKPRSNRFLVWKIRLFTAAALVAFVGMSLNNPYVTGVALVLLFIGMLLRFVPERKQPEGPAGRGPSPS